MLGARVIVGGRKYEVTFASSGLLAGHITIADGGKKVLGRVLARAVVEDYAEWPDDPRYATRTTGVPSR